MEEIPGSARDCFAALAMTAHICASCADGTFKKIRIPGESRDPLFNGSVAG